MVRRRDHPAPTRPQTGIRHNPTPHTRQVGINSLIWTPVYVLCLAPRGVVLGVEVARALEAPLDLIVVRKIGHPFSPEYAIGAVAEDGYIVTKNDMNPSLMLYLAWNDSWE